jgi:hypothetical protein
MPLWPEKIIAQCHELKCKFHPVYFVNPTRPVPLPCLPSRKATARQAVAALFMHPAVSSVRARWQVALPLSILPPPIFHHFDLSPLKIEGTVTICRKSFKNNALRKTRAIRLSQTFPIDGGTINHAILLTKTKKCPPDMPGQTRTARGDSFSSSSLSSSSVFAGGPWAFSVPLPRRTARNLEPPPHLS